MNTSTRWTNPTVIFIIFSNFHHDCTLLEYVSLLHETDALQRSSLSQPRFYTSDSKKLYFLFPTVTVFLLRAQTIAFNLDSKIEDLEIAV